MQCLKMHEMDLHPNTVDYSARRTGKTAVKEMYIVEQLATQSHQECGIVAPRMQQSQNNLNYHTDAIKRSAMLKSFIQYTNGRAQLRDTGYQFCNLSRGSAYGIMSQIDGDSITIASLEETDDMPQDRLLSRFLPMLGAARRLSGSAGALAGVGSGGVAALLALGYPLGEKPGKSGSRRHELAGSNAWALRVLAAMRDDVTSGEFYDPDAVPFYENGARAAEASLSAALHTAAGGQSALLPHSALFDANVAYGRSDALLSSTILFAAGDAAAAAPQLAASNTAPLTPAPQQLRTQGRLLRAHSE